MITTILKRCTEDTKFVPFKHNKRHRLATRAIVVNEVPKRYLVRKVCELDFWNDISGFFHTNALYHKIVDTTNGAVEIPVDVSCISQDIESSWFMVAAGDHFVDKDYNVWCCYGWENESGGAEIYFDFV